MNQPPPPPLYPPPPPGAPGPAPGAMGMAIPQKNGIAIAALICSLVGLIPCTFCIPSLVGVILGIVGISKGSKTGVGKGMGVAGLIIGIAGICLFFATAGFFYNLMAGGVDAVDPTAEKYFKLISDGKYDEAYDMTSPEFKTATSLESFKRFCKDINQKYGKYEKKEVNLLGGSNLNVQYNNMGHTVSITYIVDFDKAKGVRRSIMFKKSGGDWLVVEDKIQ